MRVQAGVLTLTALFISSCGHQDRGEKERLARENNDLKTQVTVAEEDKKHASDKDAQSAATLTDAQNKAAKADASVREANAAVEKAAANLSAANATAVSLRQNLAATTAEKDAAEKQAADAKAAKDAADLRAKDALSAKVVADKNVEAARAAEEVAKKENEANKKALASAQSDLASLTMQKVKLDQQVQQLSSTLSDDRKEKEGLKASLDKVKGSLDASLHGDPLSNLMNDWTNNLTKIISRIAEISNPPVAELRSALVKAGVSLSENPSQDELSAAIGALNLKVTRSTASLDGLQKSLKEAEDARAKVSSDLSVARSESERLQAIAVANTNAVIAPLAGIWMAESTEDILPKDCLAFFVVGAAPSQILRAVVCDNGEIETSTTHIDGVTTEPSRFAGALQFTTAITQMASSCSKDQKSRLPAFGAIAFDLHTVSGGEVSSYGFTNFGSQEIDIHSASGITDLFRTKDCAKIVQYATEGGNDASRALKGAAKACQIEKQATGCFTADNKFAPSLATQPTGSTH